MDRTRTSNRDSDIEALEGGLHIDEHALDEALLQQPDLLYRVSKQLAFETSRRDAAKQELAEIEAAADNELREDAARAEEKITEGGIKAQLRLNQKVKEATRTYLELCRRVDMWQALLDAYKQRSYALKELVTLHTANYFGDVTQTSTQRGYKDHAAHIAKERMKEERTRRE